MNIGIMTIFRTGNYGATLQAYATWKAINENNLGEAEIINYCCDGIKGKIDIKFLRKVGAFRTIVACIEKLYYYPRMKKTLAFVDSFVKGPILKKDELSSLNEKYDLFLSGSDQIWNPDIQLGDHSYLLDFVSDNYKKRSYASSFGVASLQQPFFDQWAALLNSYERISVRETSGAELVKKLINKEVPVVLDPTMLLTPRQWEDILPKAKHKDKYVFVYQMAHSGLLAKYAKEVGAFAKSKILYIPFPIGGACKCKISLSMSSLDWLRAIHDSEFVITDSFHGIVFSIIFRRQFYYIITSETVKKRLSRLSTLLTTLGLEDRIVETASDFHPETMIDYDLVHDKLNAERDRSLNILKELLS